MGCNLLKVLCLMSLVALVYGCVSAETITGRPYNLENKCWEQTQNAGQGEEGRACDTGTVYAKDLSGQIWEFVSCMPDDFVAIDDSELRNTLYDSPACE